MYGECLYAAVLQLLGQRHYYFVLGVPAQTGFGGNGHINSINHCTGYFEHAGHVLQQTGTSPLACHTLYGTAKVDVEHIGVGTLHYYLRSIAHSHGVLAVYLYGHWALGLAHGEFFETFVDHAYQGIGCHKFGIYH